MKTCAECKKPIELGHRICDCGAVLHSGCRDAHVAECDADEKLDDDAGLGVIDEGGEA
jgi:hypothetical protein